MTATTAAPAAVLTLHRVQFIDQYKKQNFEPSSLGVFDLHSIPAVDAKVRLADGGVWKVVDVVHNVEGNIVEVTLDWLGG